MNLDLPTLPEGWRWRVDKVDGELSVHLDRLHERRFLGPKWKQYAIRPLKRRPSSYSYYSDNSRYERLSVEEKIKDRAEDIWSRRQSYIKAQEEEKLRKEKENSLVGIYGESEAL